jgi:hypothetical protein
VGVILDSQVSWKKSWSLEQLLASQEELLHGVSYAMMQYCRYQNKGLEKTHEIYGSHCGDCVTMKSASSVI